MFQVTLPADPPAFHRQYEESGEANHARHEPARGQRAFDFSRRSDPRRSDPIPLDAADAVTDAEAALILGIANKVELFVAAREPSDRHEANSDACLDGITGLRRFKSEGIRGDRLERLVAGWVWRCAKNRRMRRLRDRGIRRTRSSAALGWFVAQPEPAPQDHRRIDGFADLLLDGLTEKQRDAVLSRAFDEIPQRAAAEAIGTGRQTVNSRIRKSRPKVVRNVLRALAEQTVGESNGGAA